MNINRESLISVLEQVYLVEANNYTTDIIFKKDGTIRTHNHFGSCDYRDPEIIFVYSVTPAMKDSFIDWIREGLTDEQIQHCDENHWLSMWQTESNNVEDWTEFSQVDVEWYDTIEFIQEKMNQELK